MSHHHLRKAQRRWGLLSAIIICMECMLAAGARLFSSSAAGACRATFPCGCIFESTSAAAGNALESCVSLCKSHKATDICFS
jgi:hypothetical protein